MLDDAGQHFVTVELACLPVLGGHLVDVRHLGGGVLHRGRSEPYVRVTRFVSGDADGAEQESWTETPDGVRLTEPHVGRSTWLEFQDHASMPAATTEVHEEPIEIPAGRFDCLRYTRREGDSVSTFWFARSAPGMPLRFEERVDGEVVFSSTALENIPAP